MADPAQDTNPGSGNCYFCKKPCTDGAYCYGCKVHVCDACDVSCGETPWGSHAPEAHLREPD